MQKRTTRCTRSSALARIVQSCQPSSSGLQGAANLRDQIPAEPVRVCVQHLAKKRNSSQYHPVFIFLCKLGPANHIDLSRCRRRKVSLLFFSKATLGHASQTAFEQRPFHHNRKLYALGNGGCDRTVKQLALLTFMMPASSKHRPTSLPSRRPSSPNCRGSIRIILQPTLTKRIPGPIDRKGNRIHYVGPADQLLEQNPRSRPFST